MLYVAVNVSHSGQTVDHRVTQLSLLPGQYYSLSSASTELLSSSYIALTTCLIITRKLHRPSVDILCGRPADL